MRRLFIVLLLAISSAQAAHITDKLLVGLYAKPETSTKPTKVLPSGTPLEILEQKGAYSRVRLGDGKEGWVKSVYISKEKPARAMLLELQAKSSTLQNKLQQAEKDLKAAQSKASPDTSGEIDKLKSEFTRAQERLALANSALKNEQQETKRLGTLLKKASAKGSDDQTAQIKALKQKLSSNEDELMATLHEARLLQDLLKKTDQAASQRIAALENEVLLTRKRLEEEKNKPSEVNTALTKQNAELKRRLSQINEIMGVPLPEVEQGGDSGFSFNLDFGLGLGIWPLIIVLLLLAGGIGGIAYKSHHARQRYGGMRI
jgi:SH3 domain protein